MIFFLSVNQIDSIFKTCSYPQVFLEECIIIVQEKKMLEYITYDLEISSDDSDIEDSHEENSNE